MEFTTFVSFFTLGLFIYVFFGIRSLSESHRSLIASHDSCYELLNSFEYELNSIKTTLHTIGNEINEQIELNKQSNLMKDDLRALEARIQALNDHLAAVSTCAKEEACEPSTAEKIKARKKKL